MGVSTRKLILLTSTLLALAPAARAADPVEFPDEELAQESVLPVFDRSESVKYRTIRTAGRIEFGPVASYSLLEPFYQQASFGATGTYHFNETSALNIFGTYFMQGLNENGNNLNPIPGSSPQSSLNAQYAPQSKYMLLGNYQFTPFYGKISITKEFVMNLSIYGFAGAGGLAIGDIIAPIGNIGFGQKLYFGQNFALRMDLRFAGYMGPDVLSRNLQNETKEQSASSFDKKLNFTSMVSVGAVFLL